MKVAPALKKKIRWSFSALYALGLAYWLTRLFLRHPGPFGGDAPHPAERALGPLHLAAALYFLFMSGIVWAQHGAVSYRTGRSRNSGWGFYALLSLLGLSAIAMLYGSEDLIHFAEKWHPWIGASMLPVLAYHWLRPPKQ